MVLGRNNYCNRFHRRKNEDVLKAKQSNWLLMKQNSKLAEATQLVNAVSVQRRSVEKVKLKLGTCNRGQKDLNPGRKENWRRSSNKTCNCRWEDYLLKKDRPNFSVALTGFESIMPNHIRSFILLWDNIEQLYAYTKNSLKLSRGILIKLIFLIIKLSNL